MALVGYLAIGLNTVYVLPIVCVDMHDARVHVSKVRTLQKLTYKTACSREAFQCQQKARGGGV